VEKIALRTKFGDPCIDDRGSKEGEENVVKVLLRRLARKALLIENKYILNNAAAMHMNL